MEVNGIIIQWIYLGISVRGDNMKYYSYVIPRDYGFAPNPYFGYCTLATCKPRIRKGAQKGDWIAAYGAANTEFYEKLVVLMKVEETLTFDGYWNDPRFKNKRPVFNRGISYMYGDNIYHRVDGNWMQEPSHHSMMDGSINIANLERDTKTDIVLLSTEFYYFGNNAIQIPKKFDGLIGRGRNHRVSYDNNIIVKFINFVSKNYDMGINGIPYSRKGGVFAHYKGER